MDISLLAIDVDGTLVTDDDQVSKATREALRRAHGEGLNIVLATGRRYRTTRRVMDDLDLRLPTVCLGGALTKDHAGATLHAEPFSADQVTKLLTLARRRELALILQRDAHDRGGPDFVVDAAGRWNAETRFYARLGGGAGQPDEAPERAGHEDVLVVGCFGSRQPLAALARDIALVAGNEFASVLVKSKKTPGWYLEILIGHVSKWTGLRRFAAGIGIAETAICAVGDALNDLPMIRGAGFGVAMGNADATTKAAADWITGANHQDGLVALMERLRGRR